MAKKHDYEEFEQNERISPYAQDDAAYDEVDDEAYDDYDEQEDDEAYSAGGFFSTRIGKLAVGVIALLVIVVIVLLVISFTRKPDDTLPAGGAQQTAVQETDAPASIIFAPTATEQPTAEPVQQAEPVPTDAPTKAPTPTPTAEPTAEPEPTATPLPIILSNTPTPSPTPTMTPTPSPTATPSPSPVPQLATGKVNREANLRQSASSTAKVKSKVKNGETVTVHESVLDKDGKVWYQLTVDDLAVTGWMRDYVVNLDEKIAEPTHTPNPDETPAAAQTSKAKQTAETEETAEPEKPEEKAETTPEPTKEPEEDVIGTGKTNKEANVRKIMNGKVLVQLKKNKKVDILSVKTDKNGKIWYEVRPQGSSTVGFVRDYLITLDAGTQIDMPTATPKATDTPAPEQTEKSGEAEQQDEDILDREVIGKAKTKREANVRTKPVSGAKLVRQLSAGVDLMILEKYQDAKGNIWYEVCTESGRTTGFVRDYLLNFSQIDKNREAKTYTTKE